MDVCMRTRTHIRTMSTPCTEFAHCRLCTGRQVSLHALPLHTAGTTQSIIHSSGAMVHEVWWRMVAWAVSNGRLHVLMSHDCMIWHDCMPVCLIEHLRSDPFTGSGSDLLKHPIPAAVRAQVPGVAPKRSMCQNLDEQL
eukprot:1137507-Pelagomonas_calceolata.AAC.1